jgi:uncharacterized membrane protein YqiK
MSLSESASAQVQAILQAAEASAEQIKADAEAEAERIRSAARESKQEDLSGVLATVASLRKDLDALEARLKELAGPPAAPETPKTTRAPKAAPTVAADPPAAASDPDVDAEGARLIALNMALNGTPREETDRYLADNFQLADRDALLDDVYSSVES